MMKIMKKFHLLVWILAVSGLAFSIAVPYAGAQSDSRVCVVYFTGIGCPHCAKADPHVFGKILEENPNLVIIEYEIYQEGENAPLLSRYNDAYGSGLGIPLLIFGNGKAIIGDTPIIEQAGDAARSVKENPCPLPDGSSVPFSSIAISSLPGKPKIWAKDRLLIPEGSTDDETLRSLVTAENITAFMSGLKVSAAETEPAPISGGSITFQNAVRAGGALFEWNGECGIELQNNSESCTNESGTVEAAGSHITLLKIVSLAAVDAVNPCALAVLTLMLIAIMTYNPGKKRNVILAGLAFTLSVFAMYLVYGLVIIKLFQLVQAITYIRLTLYKILGVAAILLGILNLKDFIRYRPGGFMTEMPMFMRPKAKKIINRITSPSGAFVMGMFVTLFLLPCTIGPYVIAGGMLSAFELLQTLPLLMLYNFIFVLPMIAITVIVYAGMREVENVSGWKDRNIRYLHLIAGTLITVLGLGMLLGWF